MKSTGAFSFYLICFCFLLSLCVLPGWGWDFGFKHQTILEFKWRSIYLITMICPIFRHDNVQYLEKMKQLVLFIERTLEDKVDCCNIYRWNFVI